MHTFSHAHANTNQNIIQNLCLEFPLQGRFPARCWLTSLIDAQVVQFILQHNEMQAHVQLNQHMHHALEWTDFAHGVLVAYLLPEAV